MSRKPELAKPPHLKLAYHLAEAGREVAQLNAPSSQRPVAGSQSAEDQLVEDWDHPGWGRPPFELLYDVNRRLMYISDLLLSQAAILRADRVFLSLGPVTRTLLEVCGMVSWIYDADIDLRGRIARRYTSEFEAITEMMNIASPRASKAGADPDASKHRDRYFAAAVAVGLEPKVIKRGASRHDDIQLVDSYPTQQALIQEVVGATFPSRALGPLVQRTLSALAHGQTHGLAPFMQGNEGPGTSGTYVREAVLGLDWLGTFGILSIEAVDVAIGRVGFYLGLDLRNWEAIRDKGAQCARSLIN